MYGIDTSLPDERILKDEHGLPKYIWVSNGPEFISNKQVQC